MAKRSLALGMVACLHLMQWPLNQRVFDPQPTFNVYLHAFMNAVSWMHLQTYFSLFSKLLDVSLVDSLGLLHLAFSDHLQNDELYAFFQFSHRCCLLNIAPLLYWPWCIVNHVWAFKWHINTEFYKEKGKFLDNWPRMWMWCEGEERKIICYGIALKEIIVRVFSHQLVCLRGKLLHYRLQALYVQKPNFSPLYYFNASRLIH